MFLPNGKHDCLVFSNPFLEKFTMSERKADPGTKSTLEIILEFGHKAILKEKPVQVKKRFR